MIRSRSFTLTSLMALLLAGGLASAAGGPEDAAQAAAESWLRLVDGGDYSASWDHAAAALKGAVKQADWAETLKGVRAPLGRLASRKLKSRDYTEKPPTTRTIGGSVYTVGAGKYVVIQYDAAFANRAQAVETVIATGSDAGWRVSGYSIR